MADELPSGDRAVFAFLEMVALAFAFEGVSALLNGKSWITWVPALACAALFFVAGVRWPWIKRKLLSVDWVLWHKRINRTLLIVLVLAFITFVATGYYAWRQASLTWSQLSTLLGQYSNRLQRGQLPKPQNEQAPKAQNAPAVASTGRVDWHDKQNWRRYLRTGMTRTEVRQLFGDPEKISVVSSAEFWEYGSGEVHFEDGSLYAWFEPNP